MIYFESKKFTEWQFAKEDELENAIQQVIRNQACADRCVLSQRVE